MCGRSVLSSLLVPVVLISVQACRDVGRETPNEPEARLAVATESRVIQVAPPTGVPRTDRAHIEAAIARARPGDVVLFRPGTYAIGLEPPSDFIFVNTPRLTLRGSPHGRTILRGGEIPADFTQAGFALEGGGHTVENLTFEHFTDALVIGGFLPEFLGGNTVRGNTFRNVILGVAVFVRSDETSDVSGNRFVNAGIPFVGVGGKYRFRHNVVTAPNPRAVPVFHQPLLVGELVADALLPARGNLIEGNRADGVPDGFFVLTFGDSEFRGSVINHNVFRNQRVFTEFDLGTMVTFLNAPNPFQPGVIIDNAVQGNTLEGTAGIGLLLSDARRTQILHNVIQGVRKKADLPPELQPGGVGIFVGPESHGNELAGNVLRNNAFFDIVLQGNRNVVALLEANDTVLDQGRNNEITIAGSSASVQSGPPLASALRPEELRRRASAKMRLPATPNFKELSAQLQTTP